MRSIRCIYPIKSPDKGIGPDNSAPQGIPDSWFHQLFLDGEWCPRCLRPANSVHPGLALYGLQMLRPSQATLLDGAVQSGRNLYHRVGGKLTRILSKPRQHVDVLMVNTFEQQGGAARAAHRIFCGIKKHYPDSRYLTLIKEEHDHHVVGLLRTSVNGAIAQRLIGLDHLPLRFYSRRRAATFSPSFWPNPLRIPLKRFRPGLVHLNWVSDGVLRVEELAQLHCPIVWTLHDAWAFTGGCHYTSGCEAFKRECGHCPQLGSIKEKDISRSLVRRKHRSFDQLDLTVVTPSHWLARMAGESSLFGKRRIRVIPYGLDTQVFKPFDMHAARRYLDLPPENPVLLFGAGSLDDPRKGGDLLREALHRLDSPCTLLTLGRGHVSPDGMPHVTVRPVGMLSDNMSLALIYSAADVFLCPSREDNLPNTVVEALACGTPCAAFDINGLPDMITHKENGWLARPFDPEDLARGIRYIFDHSEPRLLREAARSKALSEYSLDCVAKRYADLYAELMMNEASRR